MRDPPRRRQFPDLTLVDARLRLEVEVRQLADCREVGDLERHLDAPFVLARHLALDEERERLAQRQLLLRGLVEQAVELVPDGGQLQPRQPAEERLMVTISISEAPAGDGRIRVERAQQLRLRPVRLGRSRRGPRLMPTRCARSVIRVCRPVCSMCSATTSGP